MADTLLTGEAENAAESPCMHVLIQSGGLSHIVIVCTAIGNMLYSTHSRCSAFVYQGFFGTMELLLPSPLVAGPEAVHIHHAYRPKSGCLPLRQIPHPHLPPVAVCSHAQLPRSWPKFSRLHPSQVGCYPSIGRSGLWNWRTIGQQAGGLSKPGSPWCCSVAAHQFDSVLHVDVLCLREHHSMPVTMPSRPWHRCRT